MFPRYIRALGFSVLLFSAPLVLALTESDIPSACKDQCANSVSLLNGCGLNTSGNNANSDNQRCFCDGAESAGYDDCTSCVRNHDDDDDNSNNDDNDDDDYRKRSIRTLTRRDLLGSLLDVHDLLCTTNAVVSDVTSIVGGATSAVESVVTSLLGVTTTRTTRSNDYDYTYTTTYYSTATATVTATNGADKSRKTLQKLGLAAFGAAGAAVFLA